MTAVALVPDDAIRLRRWQATTIVLLFLGYGGYYFCRSDLSVALPLILQELQARGLDAGTARIRMGAVVSFGVFAYAIGKLTLAGIADFFGGKRNFLAGMAGAVVFTLLFAAGGSLPLFTLAWVGNRFVQSAGWAGLVKVSSRWFDFSSYGTVMGILSISFLVGDAAAREMMSGMIASGFGWRALFVLAAIVMFVIFLANAFILRESRSQLGFSEPLVNPINVFRGDASVAGPRNVRGLLLPLLRSRGFWIVCLISLGTTLVRETFNTWTPTYLNQFVGLSEARSAFWSSLFPSAGVVSVLLTGWLSDRLGARGRSAAMFTGLLIAAAALFAMARVPFGGSSVVAIALLGVVAMGLIGPYTCLAGAMAMDFGGARGGAVSSGFIDGVGYLGGVLAGGGVARISVAFGWQGAFGALAVICLGAALAAVMLFRTSRLTTVSV